MINQNSSNKSNQWQTVVNYYNSLSNEFERQLYLSTLKTGQRAHLLSIVAPLSNIVHEAKSNIIEENVRRSHRIYKESSSTPSFDNKLEPAMKEGLSLQKSIKKKCVKELYSRFQSGEFKMQHQHSLKDLNVSNIASDNSSLASGSIVFDRGFEASFEAKSSDKKIKRNKWKTKHKFAFTGIFLAAIGLFSLIFSTTIETKYQDTRLAYANTMYGQDYIAWIENITGGNEEYDKDLDLDGLTNIEEFYLHSHPDNRDCNNNGKIDVLDYLSGDLGQSLEVNKDEVAKRFGKQVLAQMKESNGYSEELNNYLNEVPNTSEDGFLSIDELDLFDIVVKWGVEDLVEDELQDSLVYYEDTKLPGQVGNTYLYGSSKESGVLKNLSDLKPQDTIYLRARTNQDRIVQWKYVVVGSNLYNSDDVIQFKQDKVTELSLATLTDEGFVMVTKSRLVDVHEVEGSSSSEEISVNNQIDK